MARLARFGFAAMLAAALCAAPGGPARATPFSDVPSNHWAYQYIQSLAADGLVVGYPDGEFKGDRPLTRYEMAVVVARVIANLQERHGEKPPSRQDLDKLQKLIDALKDELDALGVRVTNLEDSLDALDRRTKFAQSLSLHGAFLPNVTARQIDREPSSVVNGTGAPVTPYYAGAAVAPGSAAGIDPFVNAYISTDDTNNPLTNNDAGIEIRQDDRFDLVYAATDQLTVSLPVHILNFEFGGEFSQDSKFDVEPGVDIALAHAGAISDLHFKFGVIDDMTSSLLGLAFRAPQGYNGSEPYEDPFQPDQKGALVRGTVGEGAFGATDFEVSFTRVDDTLLDTQPGVTDPGVLPFDSNLYFYPIVPPPAGYVQTSPAGALKTDVFHAGTGSLSRAFLTNKAVDGSVYVSSYDGAAFGSNGVATVGGGAAPAFTFVAAYNEVIFGSALPPGSVVAITYRNLSESNDNAPQRYMTHARFAQKFKGYAGAEIGFTYNRIFDYDGFDSATDASTMGVVSDAVLGVDARLPLPFTLLGPGTAPVLYGEAASSRYSADLTTTPPVGDGAVVGGVRFHVARADLSLQYQSIGSNYFSGAPLGFYGNAPQLFADQRLGYLPDFFGFGNTLGINREFDGQFTAAGLASPGTAANPNLTFLNPLFNPFRATGPEFYSAFAPNSRGISATASSPVRVGGLQFTTTGTYQNLEEIAANGGSTSLYGPTYASRVPLRYTTYAVGAGISLPTYAGAATVHLSSSFETLQRFDTTPEQYYPIDPGTNAFDATSVAGATVAFPTGGPYGAGSRVSYYPNYVNVRHITYTASGSLPLTAQLTLGASYSTQRYGGAYGTTVAENISERKDYYTGSLTYNIPKTNSSLTFLSRRYVYHDDVLPNDDFGENRQDLTFAVRF